ncbi:glycosyl-4,4'-diaponeurosporenoate acyltransferase [Sinobaca sp. H24]|uniref:glycosyl-4,4'-diaponeurosporenoate acyltransferase CrtO family protein n=1 Tax=Sinobaca sp. H24 TaxID=2923376 RepID=UPI00207ACE1C|nr:glycosyl-4,4'-diaponeurosporenoate acyltransferase [Sinobaca sp. H24]
MIWINAAAWLFIHLSIGTAVYFLSSSVIASFSWLYRIREWEEDGKVYDALKIKKWKDRLPEASSWTKLGISKSTLSLRNTNDIAVFYTEANRSELSHWLQILPAPLFFLFNEPWVGWFMIVYAVGFNLPFIMIQRYNRGRLQRWERKRI